MISEHYCRVAKFMLGAGQQVLLKPTIPDEDVRKLRVRLLLEELQEYTAASGLKLVDPATDQTVDLTKLAVQVDGNPDLIRMADGLADLSVVTTGALVACGIADESLLEEVDNNNLMKIKNGHTDPETGKFLKAEDHPPPDIRDVLLRQGWSGEE